MVDREEPLEPDQVEGDDSGVAVAAGGEPAGDRRTSSEGDDRQVVLDREGEDRRDVVVVAGSDHDVGSVAEVAGPHPEQVGRRLAAGPQPAHVVVGEDVLGADEVGQRLDEVRGEPAPRYGGRLHGRPVLETEGQLDQSAGRLRERSGQRRVTPARGVHLGLPERERG